MKILKTIRLLRLTLIEYRIKRLQSKKFKLSLKFNKYFDLIHQDIGTELNDVISQLKNVFGTDSVSEVDDE